MKNIFIIITISLGLSAMNAQVAIDIETVRPGAILDFPVDLQNTKGGIILPRLINTQSVANPIGGSLAYNQALQQVEFYNETSQSWERLTAVYNGFAEFTNPGIFQELDAEGVVISTGPTIGTAVQPTGVLVLKASDKALVLPNVADATQLPSPKAGTIVYDMKSQSLAVYNGKVWSFWN